MHRVVHVDAHATVDVHRGVRDPVAGLGGPEGGRGHLHVSGQILGQPPGRLLECQSQTFYLDVVIGQPLPDSLEATDRAAELLAGSGVLGGEFQCPLQHAELVGGQAQRPVGAQPRQHVAAADEVLGAQLHTM